jgi:hypothetical protein
MNAKKINHAGFGVDHYNGWSMTLRLPRYPNRSLDLRPELFRLDPNRLFPFVQWSVYRPHHVAHRGWLSLLNHWRDRQLFQPVCLTLSSHHPAVAIRWE